MSEILHTYNLGGLITGLSTFLIIGIFHPLVIKGEYHFGQKCRFWFLIAGIICLIACLQVSDSLASSLLGVTSFSCFWSIKEIKEQKERVRKGWFPRKPTRIQTDKES